jgi:NAD(P)-dependent dehydrogenase (short-subunit alcohol dehydrogenase family)
MKWKASDIPDLRGKIAMVTGANSGLGYQESLALARKGAMVILAVRNREKGLVALDRIKSEIPDAELVVMKLDLANIESVKHVADSFLEEFERLDILINNAGLMAGPLLRTTQGFEIQFGTNHLGHFALTALLIDLINRTPASRIINVSSLAYKMGKINFDDLNWNKSYSGWAAYCASKLANLLFTIELDRKLRLAEKPTIIAAAHPGLASTNLHRKGVQMERSKFKNTIANLSYKLFAQSAGMGALPILYAATAAPVKSSKFYGPGGLFQLHGYPKEIIIDPNRIDSLDALRLWEESEKLTGIKFIMH